MKKDHILQNHRRVIISEVKRKGKYIHSSGTIEEINTLDEWKARRDPLVILIKFSLLVLLIGLIWFIIFFLINFFSS